MECGLSELIRPLRDQDQMQILKSVSTALVQLSGFLIVPAADGCFPQGMDQKLLGASSISALLAVGNRDFISLSLGP